MLRTLEQINRWFQDLIFPNWEMSISFAICSQNDYYKKRSRFDEKNFLFANIFGHVKLKFWKLRRTIREIFKKPLCNCFFCNYFLFSPECIICTYGKIEISALEYCGVPYWVEKIGEWCRFCRLKLQNIGLRGLFSLQFENWMLTNIFPYRVFHTTMSLEHSVKIS